MKSVVLVNDTTTQMHHGCELVMKQIRNMLALRDIKVIATSEEGTDWRKDSRFLAAVKKCDGIIVNGEGTIHHNRPAGRMLLEVSELAQKHNVPIFLINTTYQENPAEFKQYLDKFDGIFVREGDSAADLKTIAVSSVVVPDLTLSYDYAAQHSRTGIGVSDSSIEPISRQLFSLCQANDGKFLPVLRSYKYDGVLNLTELLRDIKFNITRFMLRFTKTDNYLAIRNLYLKKSITEFFREIAS
jgi:polysaccharide pyruvyl transferase WcaK-like protein